MMTKRVAYAALLGAALGLSACNGWPQAPELAEVKNKPEKYPTYAAVPANQVQPFTFEDRRWMIEPAVLQLSGAALTGVGNAGSAGVFAPAGDQAPHNVLFSPAGGDRWHAVLPIE